MNEKSSANFSSGPTNKGFGWTFDELQNSLIGRSHRSRDGMQKIHETLELIRTLMKIPENFYVALTPGSATGAFEMALWSFLGPKPVNIISYDVFGEIWKHDILNELKIKNYEIISADFGELPNLSNINFSNDTVFVWSATTSSVQIPNQNWIKKNRQGLTFCDAAASAFAIEYDFDLFDVMTFSFQKMLGCEASLGVIIISQRAMERLQNYTPTWPIPRLFRIKTDGKINLDFFHGATINTPSMICIEDYIFSLKNAIKIGGISKINEICKENQKVIEELIINSKNYDFLIKSREIRSISNTCIVLKKNNSWENLQKITKKMEELKLGFDILGHSKGKPCIRIWHGVTISKDNIKNLIKNLEKITEIVQKE